MILRRVKLFPFAGLTSQELCFKEGLNVVLGPNEAGKSTVFRAIEKSLFTKTKLNKNEFAKEIQPFLPIGGDTARIELEFSVNDSLYILKRTWGPRNTSELVLPDGNSLTDESAIRDRLEEHLPASEGTCKSTLMTYQSGLSETLEELFKDHPETMRDLGDILRMVALNTDGVSLDDLRERVNSEYDRYLGKWDVQKNAPEKGRGIEDRWKKETGIVVKSFYDKEEIRQRFEAAGIYEEQYDRVNRQIKSAEETIGKLEDFVGKNSKAAEDAKEHEHLLNRVRACNAEISGMKDANNQWPVCESKISEIASILPELERNVESLKKEEIAANREMGNKEIRDKFERVKSLKLDLDNDMNIAASTKKLTAEELEELREADQTIVQLKKSIVAGKLAISFAAKKEIALQIEKDFEPPVKVSVPSSESKTFAAGGRIKINHNDWSLEVTSGEGNFDQLRNSYSEADKKLRSLLDSRGINSLKEAADLNKDYQKREQEVERAKYAFEKELGREDYERLEKQVIELGEPEPVRPITDIASDLAKVIGDSEGKKKDLRDYREELQNYTVKYETKDKLILELGKKVAELDDTQSKIKNLASLPPGFTDGAAFIQQFDEAKASLELEKKRKSGLDLDRARLEGQAPEQSVEDLQAELSTLDEKFHANLRKGKAVARLREVTEQLVKAMDAGTFKGLEQNILQHFAYMTDNRYIRVEMEESLPKGFVRRDGKNMPADLLSIGTKDVLGLSLRLSIAKYFLESTDGFMMMDDPLVDLDPDRQEKAAEVIQRFAAEKQVVIFTCHPSHSRMLGGNEISMA
jgi:exonuclease SbcC